MYTASPQVHTMKNLKLTFSIVDRYGERFDISSKSFEADAEHLVQIAVRLGNLLSDHSGCKILEFHTLIGEREISNSDILAIFGAGNSDQRRLKALQYL